MAKIGILATRYATQRNLESIIFRIGSILAQRHEVEIITHGEVSPRIAAHFTIRQAGSRLFGIPLVGGVLGRLAILGRYVREQRPDILMTLSAIGMNGLCVALAGRLTGVKSINRITSDIFRVYRYKRPLRAALRLWLKNNVFGRMGIALAHTTITLHESQVVVLRRAGFKRSRFFSVSQPIAFPEMDDPEATRDATRRALGVPGQATLVGYVGRLDQDKNPELLARVLSIVLEGDPRARAVIVGDGPMRGFLESSLPRDRCSFTGALQRDDIGPFYLAMDYLVQTSYSEGLSNVLAEALYHGVPVVSSDSGPITRAMISNIAATADEIASYILQGTTVPDTLPPTLKPVVNREQWLQLIDNVLSSDHDA